MRIYATLSWGWIVAATALLGVNQGLTWSMTQTAKLDITRPDQCGLTIGLNELSGYEGVALAGVLTGYAASALEPRLGLLLFGLAIVLVALVFTLTAVPDTPAAVADVAEPAWRGSAVGIYRFWRDLDHAIGRAGLGLAAHLTGDLEAAFWFVALVMLLSGAVLWRWGQETHSHLSPLPG